MKAILSILLLAATSLTAAPIAPESVAIIYNSKDPLSKDLAEFYIEKRNIPKANLIPLNVSTKGEIDRQEFNQTIRDPLRKIFNNRNWWVLHRNTQRQVLPSSSKITTLICMRGVPYKIKQAAIPPLKNKNLPPQLTKPNCASVDQELALLGVHNIPAPGPATNPYYKKDTPFSLAHIPYMLLVGRIDGPDYTVCKRMIDDAIATEARGLWGMCYLDIAKKGTNYAIGDQWLENIAHLNNKTGIPTVVDRTKQTFTTNYPMNDAALYYGWYARHRNGPLLNPEFKFRRGAIAIHLHSFNASNIRTHNKHWAGPILTKGAAATVGNVYEPYLQLSHYFDILHDRLLKGHTLVEAAYMSIPVLSWQGIVLGDPLYRPFLHLNGTGQKDPNDRDYRAIRVANERWGDDPETMVKKLRTAAAAKSNAKFYEYLGLWHRARKQNQIAIAFFQTAAKKHMKESDRLRQWLYTADIHRASGNKPLAIATLKKAKQTHSNIPETKSLTATLNILNPPPPPPAKEAAEKSRKNKKNR